MNQTKKATTTTKKIPRHISNLFENYNLDVNVKGVNFFLLKEDKADMKEQ